MSGGIGKRFGSDKTKALLAGKPLYRYGLELGLEVSGDVMHVSRNILKYEPFIKGVRYIEDEYPYMCPMAGMITAANHALNKRIFILSADAPLFDKKLIQYFDSIMGGYDAVIPLIDGKYYNLAALYSKKMLKGLLKFYNNGVYKITESLSNFNVLFLQEDKIFSISPSKASFLNLNTEEELQKAAEIFKLL